MKAVVDTVAGTLAEINIHTLGQTLLEVKAKALVETLETLTQVKSEALFDRLAKRVSK